MAKDSLADLTRQAIDLLQKSNYARQAVGLNLSGRQMRTVFEAAKSYHAKLQCNDTIYIWYCGATDTALLAMATTVPLPTGAEHVHTIAPKAIARATQPEELVYKPFYRPVNGRDIMAFDRTYGILMEKVEPLGGYAYLSFILQVSLETLRSWRRRHQYSLPAACKLDNIAGVREMGITMGGMVSRLIEIPPLPERAKHLPMLPVSSLRPEVQALAETTHKDYVVIPTNDDIVYLESVRSKALKRLRERGPRK